MGGKNTAWAFEQLGHCRLEDRLFLNKNTNLVEDFVKKEISTPKKVLIK